MARHHWTTMGAAPYPPPDQHNDAAASDPINPLPDSSLVLGNAADLHTFGTSWMGGDRHRGGADTADNAQSVDLEQQDLQLLDEARRVIFRANGPPANKSECAERIMQHDTQSAASTTTGPSANSAVFRAWRALDQNDGATLSEIVAKHRLPLLPTPIDLASIERRMQVIGHLLHELALEDEMLRELSGCQYINPIIYAIDNGAMSCVDGLLDAGVGFSSRKSFNVELASVVRTCSPLQVARMLANCETNLIHLEQSFLLTKQRGDGPFPFFPMRNALEEAFSFDQKYRRNQLYYLIERYRAARARNALCAVAGADPAVVTFVECMCELPQLCRALVVQFAVQVPPPPPETRRLIVAIDTVRVWIRAVVLNERTDANGQRSLFITYENWDSRYDEWIPENSDRLRPWVHPRLRAVAEAQEYLPDETIVKHWLKRSV